MINKKTIVCFVDYYFPGYKAGGPIKSIFNLVNSFDNKFSFKIITRNHDLGEKEPYVNIKNNYWNKLGNTEVYYISESSYSILRIIKILNEVNFDLIYFNSFFSLKFTILPMIILKLGFVKKSSILIAPRGEFSSEAIKLKSFKKKIYIFLFKYLKLYANYAWQVSSKFEKEDILKVLPCVKKVYIGPDITFPVKSSLEKKIEKRKSGPLRIIFLSRISPIKNLKFILNVLKKIQTRLDFSIYGPKSDLNYWNECLEIINKLPFNIKVKIYDEVPNKNIYVIFKKYDLCVLPTLGENFGHVIYESLMSGTPVLVSEKTPWRENKNGGLKTLPLDKKIWISVISNWTKFDDNFLLKKREESIKYILDYESHNSSLAKNLNIFNSLLK